MVKEDKTYAQLDKSKVESLYDVWANAIILYVVRKTPSIGAITTFIKQSWNNVAKPIMYLHEKGYFHVKFANIKDRNENLYASPHMINSRAMVIKALTPNFDFQAEILRLILLWIILYNLPLNC